ncbi:murein L,D-transpeptidase catalytic domain family protein [Sphingorhabdus arenilitoris]|uniref:Murein L,D-transpeptidase catalytic domain family protein n=1 Tax=Sphingorhabdus arenilitoris TaxID=1490041 RepID=A0ABV8RG35_9SPHN
MKNVQLARRGILKASLAAAGLAALPPRVFAAPSGIAPEHRYLVEKAKAELARLSGQLWRTDKVGMIDFSLPSAQPRLFILNMEEGSVKSYLVAHGRGSDPEHDGFLKYFSADVGSLATSRGAYLTMDWYHGKYGASMRLGGLDPDNATALDRAIVVHEAWYSNPDMIAKWGKLGRSEGCFAVSEGLNQEMLYHLGGGRLIFADKL